jgi:hypothetical protein
MVESVIYLQREYDNNRTPYLVSSEWIIQRNIKILQHSQDSEIIEIKDQSLQWIARRIPVSF